MKMKLCMLIMVLAGTALARNEIGFVERFALAEDRAKALEELIPGTPQYYFYHCLHYQHTKQRKPYDEMMAAWIKRHKITGEVIMMQNRQALIDYGQKPNESIEHIVRRLGLKFDHRRRSEVPPSLAGGLKMLGDALRRKVLSQRDVGNISVLLDVIERPGVERVVEGSQ